LGYLCWQRDLPPKHRQLPAREGHSWPHVADARKVLGTMPGGPADCSEWAFSDKVFNVLRQEIESITKWRYSGSVDLILTNAIGGTTATSVPFDYSTAININVAKAKDEKAIPHFETFVESICRFCDTYRGNDPAWGFSDYMGKQVMKSGLKALVLNLLPKSLTADARKAFHFSVEDISL
jgi:hypothetical protein